MRPRAFGSSGLWVSPIALGTGSGCDERLIHGALDLGVTLFDTARSYGDSEERLGRHLRGRDALISTKGGYGVDGVPDWTGEAVTKGIDRALGVLQVERIAIFHLHSCPMDVLVRGELHEALSRARAAGKIHVAAYSGDNAELAWAVGARRFGGVQASLSLFDQQNLPVLQQATGLGLGVLAKRPLAGAVWRGHAPRDEATRAYRERMEAMALQPDPLGWDEAAVRFGAYVPGVSALLVGATRLQSLRACVEAFGKGPLALEVEGSFRSAFSAAGREWAALC